MTFTYCVRSTETFAEGKWYDDLTNLMFPVKPAPATPTPWGAKRGREEETWTPNTKVKKKGAKGKGKDKKKGKGSKGGPGKPKIATVTVGNKKVKIAFQKGDKRYCAGYNQSNDCDGNCGFEHKCNLMMSATRVCNNNHPACEHTGKVAKLN